MSDKWRYNEYGQKVVWLETKDFKRWQELENLSQSVSPIFDGGLRLASDYLLVMSGALVVMMLIGYGCNTFVSIFFPSAVVIGFWVRRSLPSKKARKKKYEKETRKRIHEEQAKILARYGITDTLWVIVREGR